VEALLDAAGRPAGVDARAVSERRRIAGLFGLAWSGVLVALVGTAALPCLVVAPTAASMLPILQLRAAARRRGRAIEQALPETAELLSAALQSGLPLRRALAVAARHGEGVLAQELGDATRELSLGSSIEEVLARLAGRHDLPALDAVCAALLRAHQRGSAAGPALAALAEQTRGARARARVEAAARAAPKIQLVAALLLVPAALCLLAAATLAGRS